MRKSLSRAWSAISGQLDEGAVERAEALGVPDDSRRGFEGRSPCCGHGENLRAGRFFLSLKSVEAETPRLATFARIP